MCAKLYSHFKPGSKEGTFKELLSHASSIFSCACGKTAAYTKIHPTVSEPPNASSVFSCMCSKTAAYTKIHPTPSKSPRLSSPRRNSSYLEPTPSFCLSFYSRSFKSSLKNLSLFKNLFFCACVSVYLFFQIFLENFLLLKIFSCMHVCVCVCCACVCVCVCALCVCVHVVCVKFRKYVPLENVCLWPAWVRH